MSFISIYGEPTKRLSPDSVQCTWGGKRGKQNRIQRTKRCDQCPRVLYLRRQSKRTMNK